ncbi:centrosomal protein of 95 kDa-like isoform X1 [Centruroides vittatus]|uniref:centrosomal protein of 95 kDa-like isoform X1 n=1 Tax=Centruroides vittatus TaxID=120091 RepID=UPI0035100D7C
MACRTATLALQPTRTGQFYIYATSSPIGPNDRCDNHPSNGDLESIMEQQNSREESWSREEACIELTNHLIVLCNLTFPRISSLSDIKSQLLVLLFKKITGVVLHDLIKEPKTIEDEAHNIQMIIDTLSLDILNISLSHIIGEDIVKQNVISIYNLLEVMENYLLYSVQNTLRSEESVEAERDKQMLRDDQPIPLNTSIWTQTDPVSEEITSQSELEECIFNKVDQHSENKCPLCTCTSEDIEILQDGSRENVEDSTNILKDISNQSFYKTLPGRFDSIPPINYPYTKSSSNSSTSVLPERDTSESSSVPLLIPENFSGIRYLKPEFAKVGVQSDDGKLSADSVDKVSKTEMFPSESSSDLVDISQINSKMHRKIAPMKKRHQEPSDRLENFSKKKNVRFFASDAAKNFSKKNLQIYEGKVKEDLENFQAVSQSSQFVDNVYKGIFNTSNQKLTPVRKRYICRIRKKHPLTSQNTSKEEDNSHDNVIETQESTLDDNEFLRYLRDELPGIHLSSATKRRMESQYRRHLYHVGSQLRDHNFKKSKTEKQYAEAEIRKQLVSKIFQKEREHNQRMKRLKEEKQLQQRVKSTLRDNQISRIRMKHSYNEQQQFIKSKMNRKKTKEENLMRELYEEGLAIQKEELRELRKLAKEREEKEAQNHKMYMESMENFYKNQLEMLTETISAEKNLLEQRAKAQSRVLEQIRRDYRSKMERQLKDSRNKLLSNGDFHFREADAERVRNLWKKKGTTKILSNQILRKRKN